MMNHSSSVLEFKCPCCNAPLVFGGETQQLKCEYCNNSFDLDTLFACRESENLEESSEIQWDSKTNRQWSQDEQTHLQLY